MTIEDRAREFALRWWQQEYGNEPDDWGVSIMERCSQDFATLESERAGEEKVREFIEKLEDHGHDSCSQPYYKCRAEVYREMFGHDLGGESRNE